MTLIIVLLVTVLLLLMFTFDSFPEILSPAFWST